MHCCLCNLRLCIYSSQKKPKAAPKQLAQTKNEFTITLKTIKPIFYYKPLCIVQKKDEKMSLKSLTIVVALVSAVVLLITPAFFEPANAMVATQWGHLADGYSINEYNWELQVCSQINSYFLHSGYSSQNSYWDSSTSSNFQNSLKYAQNPVNGVDWASTFWVGDFIANSGTPRNYGLNSFQQGTSTTNPYLYDYDIYNYANSPRQSVQYIDFIWTCVNGGLQWNDTNGNQFYVAGLAYPTDTPTMPAPNNPNMFYGSTNPNQLKVGVPYALTGTLDMSILGYSNSDNGSYCYIGFENDSPGFSWPVPADWSSTNYQFGYFPGFFYQYALGAEGSGKHSTIHDSLDYASFMTFGYDDNWVPYNYDSSLLNNGYWHSNNLGDGMSGYWYCRMRVLGNSNLIFPYTQR
jgi:hypothetical protein